MTTEASKAILVTGATGKQGGAVIKSLLNASSDFVLLAVTRNADSEAAKKLAQSSDRVKVVQGNLDDPANVFANAKKATEAPIWGVFSVQIPAPFGSKRDVDPEERQGKALIDESIKEGVKFFVYSSVDRGGDKSIENPTNIPHFMSKHNIEKHLLEKAAGSEMKWTILRPVCFFDNMKPGFVGNGFVSMWRTVDPKPLQFIAVTDIGILAAKAFLNPEEYQGRSISLAGDELTCEQAKAVFKKKAGYELPESFGIVGKALLWMMKEMGVMFKWFKEEGYGANIEELRKMHPELMDFGAYIEKESGYMKSN